MLQNRPTDRRVDTGATAIIKMIIRPGQPAPYDRTTQPALRARQLVRIGKWLLLLFDASQQLANQPN